MYVPHALVTVSKQICMRQDLNPHQPGQYSGDIGRKESRCLRCRAQLRCRPNHHITLPPTSLKANRAKTCNFFPCHEPDSTSIKSAYLLMQRGIYNISSSCPLYCPVTVAPPLCWNWVNAPYWFSIACRRCSMSCAQSPPTLEYV